MIPIITGPRNGEQARPGRIKDAGPGGLSGRVRPRRRESRDPVRSVPFAQTLPGSDQVLGGSIQATLSTSPHLPGKLTDCMIAKAV